MNDTLRAAILAGDIEAIKAAVDASLAADLYQVMKPEWDKFDELVIDGQIDFQKKHGRAELERVCELWEIPVVVDETLPFGTIKLRTVNVVAKLD